MHAGHEGDELQHASFLGRIEVRCWRLSQAFTQRSGSIEDEPFWAGVVVLSEVAFALTLNCLAKGIGGGRALDEAAA